MTSTSKPSSSTSASAPLFGGAAYTTPATSSFGGAASSFGGNAFKSSPPQFPKSYFGFSASTNSISYIRRQAEIELADADAEYNETKAQFIKHKNKVDKDEKEMKKIQEKKAEIQNRIDMYNIADLEKEEKRHAEKATSLKRQRIAISNYKLEKYKKFKSENPNLE